MTSTNPSTAPTVEPSLLPTVLPTQVGAFKTRVENYIDVSLGMTSKFNIILHAYRNQDINSDDLQNILDAVEVNTENASFIIPDLVRLLFFNTTAMKYESVIKAAAQKFHFWISQNDKNSVWWTENKSILYLSSHFLFNQLYGWSAHDTDHLRERLLHWLQLKIKYGFYELGSRVYSPYTLKGLLNLVDFCEDKVIQTKAVEVAQLLLRHLLLSANEQGVSYSVATRDYWKVILEPTGNNYNKLMYLLTGQADSSDIAPSSIGVYLATTTLDVSPVYTYWDTHVDIKYYSGHVLSDLDSVNSNLSNVDDQILFQWVAGAYFFDHSHAERTKSLLDKYHLWNHTDFVQYGISEYEYYTLEQYLTLVAQPAAEMKSRGMFVYETKTEFFIISNSCLQCSGTVITGANVSYYKDKSAMLSSMTNWHSGYFGHQAIPWIASTGLLAMFGVVGEGQTLPVGGTCETKGLPFVVQSHNLALIKYQPDATLKAATLAEGGNVDVLFRWPFDLFDETVTSGNWTVSREGDTYVALRAVYLPADKVDEVVIGSNYIWSDADPSVWAVIVGNTNVYESFTHFISLLDSCSVSNIMAGDGQSLTSQISVDGKTLALDLLV